MSNSVQPEENTKAHPAVSGNGTSQPHPPSNGNGNGAAPVSRPGDWRQNLKAAAPSYPPIHPRPSGSPTPTSTRQEEMWVLCQFEDANPCYNIYLAWRLRGTLNLRA